MKVKIQIYQTSSHVIGLNLVYIPEEYRCISASVYKYASDSKLNVLLEFVFAVQTRELPKWDTSTLMPSNK